MSRIRTIKPELLRHAVLFDAEKSSQLPLRLAFVGLILCCDREGRFRWRPRELKLDVLPYDDAIDFTEILNVLEQYKFIVKYSVDGACYGYIPSWHKHQVINSREQQSQIPAYSPQQLSSTQHSSNNNNSRNLPNYTKPISNQVITEIFEYWKMIMDHPNATLDKKREKVIHNALKQGYSKEQLCMAIRGCYATPYNMGKNQQGERYDSLKVIFRDADQIDRFLTNYHNPPQPCTTTQHRAETNQQVAQNWLNEVQETAIILDKNEYTNENH